MTHHFHTAGTTLLPADRASVFFDGIFTSPKLSHPEGLAVGPDGWIWCGNQDGDILRIAPDASRMERVASTDGFALGMAFDGNTALYVCDLKHAAIFRLDLHTHELKRFSQPGIKIPNYPVIDAQHRRLFVSDSHDPKTPGPGVWAFDLASGDGTLWYDQPMQFANGMAMCPQGDAIFVCETFAQCITRIEIQPDGTAGKASTFAQDLPGLPDGIAFDAAGELVVGCYEPSRLLRISADGKKTDILIEDPTAHIFCHPTNIAFAGTKLYTANLGRWHLSVVDADRGAEPLWKASAP